MIEVFLNGLKAIEGEFGWVVEALAIVALVIAINFFLKWFLLYLHERFKKQGNLWKDSLIVALIKPLTSFVWFIAIVQALNFIWASLLERPLMIHPHTLISVGFILASAWFLLRWKKIVVHKLLEKSKEEGQIDFGKIDAINKLATLLIYFVTGMLLLEQSGSSMNTLIAFGGVSGLAVAFASQQIISNFFGGILIYFTQPFHIGDWIQLNEKDIEGYVEEIGWYTTRIRTFDKRPIYIPNALLTNISVTNPSRMTHRQFKQTVSLRYADLPKLPAIIKDLETFFKAQPKLDQRIAPQIHFFALGANGVEIHITAYTTIVDKYAYYDIVQDLLFGIVKIVAAHQADFAVLTTAVEFPKGIPISSASKP